MPKTLIQIYTLKEIDTKTLNELMRLKKACIVQVYQINDIIAVGRWSMAVATIRREIQTYQMYHSKTA